MSSNIMKYVSAFQYSHPQLICRTLLISFANVSLNTTITWTKYTVKIAVSVVLSALPPRHFFEEKQDNIYLQGKIYTDGTWREVWCCGKPVHSRVHFVFWIDMWSSKCTCESAVVFLYFLCENFHLYRS
jgi:hypothetical protein